MLRKRQKTLGDTFLPHTVYTPCPKKRVYSTVVCMCNFNKFKDILMIFGTYHPETPV